MIIRKNVLAFAVTATCLSFSSIASADIKIGFITTLSSTGATIGQDIIDGFNLAVEERSGKLGGQNIKILKEDDQLKPDVGVQIIQKYIEKDKVDMVVGITYSNVMMAVSKPLADADMTFIGVNAGPAPLAGKQCNPGFFFTSWQNDNQAEVMGQFANDKGYKNVYLMAPNYQAGRDYIAGFKRTYQGKVAGEVYTQLNQPDYSAELAQLQATAPEAVYVFYPGGLGVNFIKQFKQMGLMGKTPLLSASTVDGTTLPALKDSALGVYSGTFWGPDFNNPASQSFIANFVKKHQRTPSQYAAQSYEAALLIDSALQKTGGNVSDKAALRAALRAADYDSLRGSYQIGKNGFPIQDFHVFEVVKDEAGQAALKTIATPLPKHQDAYASECPL